MARTRLPLQDRNLLFIGNSSHYLASVVSQLAEEGANIFIADQSTKHLNSFIDNLSAQREIHQEAGRAFVYDFDINDLNQHKALLQKSSEYMGGSDSIIFWNESTEPLNFDNSTSHEKTENLIQTSFTKHCHLVSVAMEFLAMRRNSSLLQIFNENIHSPLPDLELASATNMARLQLSNALQKNGKLTKIKFKNLILGPTEDFLVKWTKGKNTNEALLEYKNHFPKSELLNSTDLAKSIAFLVGNNSSSPDASQLNIGISK